ncbi:MAG: NUDIX hydrolase [Sphingomonadales bacterium]
MKRNYPERPIAAVGVVLLRQDMVALIQRGNPPKKAQWSLPGGAQCVGETIQAAVQREVFEETGLRITANGLVDVVDFVERDEAGLVQYHYTLIDYWAETEDADLTAGDAASDARWVPLAELDALPIWSETKRVILRAAELRERAHG